MDVIIGCGNRSNAGIDTITLGEFWVFYFDAFRSMTVRASLVVLYRKPKSGKRWKDMNCGSSEQGRIGWNLVLEGFLGGLVTGFGMFCFGKTLRFGRMTFSWLWGYRLTRRLGMLLVSEEHTEGISCNNWDSVLRIGESKHYAFIVFESSQIGFWCTISLYIKSFLAEWASDLKRILLIMT
jgi:hypothetical protein